MGRKISRRTGDLLGREGSPLSARLAVPYFARDARSSSSSSKNEDKGTYLESSQSNDDSEAKEHERLDEPDDTPYCKYFVSKASSMKQEVASP